MLSFRRSKGPSTTNCVQAAREISDLLSNDARFAGMPVIFGGDLNSRKKSNAYQILMNRTSLKETWDSAPLANHTVFANSSAAAAGYNFADSIDHVLVTGDFKVLGAGASVRVWETKGKLVGPSDHWPVFADVRFSG